MLCNWQHTWVFYEILLNLCRHSVRVISAEGIYIRPFNENFEEETIYLVRKTVKVDFFLVFLHSTPSAMSVFLPLFTGRAKKCLHSPKIYCRIRIPSNNRMHMKILSFLKYEKLQDEPTFKYRNTNTLSLALNPTQTVYFSFTSMKI